MNEIIERINNINWADWTLENIQIDYEKIVISISDDSSNVSAINLKDYIGFYYVGHWDESVIEDINIQSKGDLVDTSLGTIKKLYGENPLPGGGTKQLDDDWLQLNINLIDGNVLKFSCKSIETSNIS